MAHAIHRVTGFEPLGGCTLLVRFEDRTEQVIDFEPVLRGEIYGPLARPAVFREVRLDPETHTLVWPNGADFDPADLHDWPVVRDSFERLARSWSTAQTDG